MEIHSLFCVRYHLHRKIHFKTYMNIFVKDAAGSMVDIFILL